MSAQSKLKTGQMLREEDQQEEVHKGEVEGEGEWTEGQRREGEEAKSGGDEQLQQQLAGEEKLKHN
jgi:hypothetical protein